MLRNEAWWLAEKGKVHERVLQYVQAVEREQSDLFDRFVKLAALYDPNDQFARRASLTGTNNFGAKSHVIDNVIAQTVDTAENFIAATKVRPRFTTDDADWSTQRQARHLTWYAEGLQKLLKIDAKAKRGFHDGGLKGTGLVKVYADRWKRVCTERVLPDDVVVDVNETRNGNPRQMHQRMLVSRDKLLAEWPEKADVLEHANGSYGGADQRYWADYRPVADDQAVVVESWYLPIGVKGHDEYKPGRHTIVVNGCDLLDEEWHKDRFPFARFVVKERDCGWYGIGMAEGIVGHQRAINKMNWQVDANLDQYARRITYVKQADARLAVQSVNRLGTVSVYKDQPPITVTPQAVSPEVYARLDRLPVKALGENGTNEFAVHGTKPPGLRSGAAMQEWRDHSARRHSSVEQVFEEFVLDIIWLVIDTCKDLGEDAPVVTRKTKFGRKRIKWSDVDMQDVAVQIQASATIPRTTAGRMSFALEIAQAGIISQESAKRLIMQDSALDLSHELNLYVAALEDIERCIEEIEDGNFLTPEPYQNLKMGIWRMQQAYLRDAADGAPEEVLEGLRNWIVQAAAIQSQAEMPQMPADPMADPQSAMAAPMDPQMAAMSSDLMGTPGDPMMNAGVTPMSFLQ